MHGFEKLWHADSTRKTRFHTSSGTLCVRPDELLYAFWTTLTRRLTGSIPEVPWIPRAARRFVDTRVRNGVVFEYSVGMSTIWYAKRAARVHAVEHDRAWHDVVVQRLSADPQVKIRHAGVRSEYVEAIAATGERSYDLISVDGIHRLECAKTAVPWLAPGGMLLVNNTDDRTHGDLPGFLLRTFPKENVHVFAGYPPCNGHPSETMVCVSPRA